MNDLTQTRNSLYKSNRKRKEMPLLVIIKILIKIIRNALLSNSVKDSYLLFLLAI